VQRLRLHTALDSLTTSTVIVIRSNG